MHSILTFKKYQGCSHYFSSSQNSVDIVINIVMNDYCVKIVYIMIDKKVTAVT